MKTSDFVATLLLVVSALIFFGVPVLVDSALWAAHRWHSYWRYAGCYTSADHAVPPYAVSTESGRRVPWLPGQRQLLQTEYIEKCLQK